jgi:hypothetical protein
MRSICDTVAGALQVVSIRFFARNRTRSLRTLRTLAHAGEVATAETQDEMEAALDRVIPPRGAWKRTRCSASRAVTKSCAMAAIPEKNVTYGAYLSIGLERS